MMTNSQIAEAFANGEDHGHANSVFIERTSGKPEGVVIYSYGYHFPIAINYGKVAYINTDKYSHTTGRHKGHVRRALEAAGCEVLPCDTDTLIEVSKKGLFHKKYIG